MNSTTDWYTTVQLPGGTSSINTIHARQSSTFTIPGDDERLIIDSGRGVGDLRGYLEGEYDEPMRLYLTHSHWDHVGNAYQFDDVSIHPNERNPDGSLTLDVTDEVFLKRPGQFVESHREQDLPFPDGFDADNFTVPPVDHVDTHEGGDVIDLGSREVEVYDIPGHTGGQTGFLDRTAGVFFAADLVHVDQNMYVHFVDSSIEDYLDSFDTAIDLKDSGAYEVIATAHNEPIEGDDLEILETLRDGLVSIQDGEQEGERIDTPWGPANQFSIGDTTVLTKTTVG